MRVITVTFVALAIAAALAAAKFDVSVPADGTVTHFDHFWKRCFGSGHAALGLRADWQEQLAEMRQELGVERVRFHGVFDDDMSVVLHKPNNYEFFNVDQLYGPMVKMGVKPVVELSFMPGQLAKCGPWAANGAGTPCPTVMHYKGIVMPPANYSEWTALVEAFATHLVSRFGIVEVRSWHFEVWNELWGMPYPTDYLALYDAARTGLKAVDSQLQIGGPVTMQCQYISEFVNDREGKFDFVSTHLYPTDPNCTVAGNEGLGDIDCFAHTIQRARAKAPQDKPFFVTEFNAGLFDAELLYSSFAAAFIFRNVPQLHGVVDIWSYWTFTDIFEENGMHGAPFAGFNYGIQTNRGIKKPVYRAYQLLHGAGSHLAQTNVTQDGAAPQPNATVTAFATWVDMGLTNNRGPTVFVSNFAPQGYAITNETVDVQVPQGPAGCSGDAVVHMIDHEHANAHAAWVRLGSPAYPDEVQLAEIKKASEVVPAPIAMAAGSTGMCKVSLRLSPFSAARVDFPRP